MQYFSPQNTTDPSPTQKPTLSRDGNRPILAGRGIYTLFGKNTYSSPQTIE